MSLYLFDLALILLINQNTVACQSPTTASSSVFSSGDKERNSLPYSSENSLISSSSKRQLSDLQDTPFFYLRQIALTTTSAEPFAPSLIEDNSGNIFVAYSSNSGAIEIYGQVLTAGLVEYVSEFAISFNSMSYYTNNPRTCLLNDGKILIVWQYAYSSQSFLYAKIINSDFTDYLTEFAVAGSGINFSSSVNSFASGRFVIAWVKDNGGDLNDIYYRIYDQTGNSLIEETRANDIVDNYQKYPKTGSFSDNSFVIAWISKENDPEADIKAKIFSQEGDTIKNEFRIAQNVHFSNFKNLDLCVISDTQFSIFWMIHDSTSNLYHIYGRFYDYRGNPLAEKFLVNSPSSNIESHPIVAKLEDGGFIVTWRREISSIYYIYAQRLDSTGGKIDEEFILSGGSQDLIYQSAISSKSGGYAVSWDRPTAIQTSLTLKIAETCESKNCRDCSTDKTVCSLCKDGFNLRNDPTGDSDPCAPCDSSCLTCSGLSNTDCTSCIESLTLVNGSCLCHDGRKPYSSIECTCPDSSFDTLSDPIECSACPLYCQACSSYNSCSLCDDGSFLEGGQCELCEENCKRCLGQKDCLECKDTFELEEGECVCPLYYIVQQRDDGENICVYKTLSFSFSSTYDLIFDKDLSSPLTVSNIAYSFFLPSLQNFTFAISSPSLSRYSLSILSKIPSGSTSIRFRFQNVEGSDGSTIKEEEREVRADVYYIDDPEEKLEEKLEEEMIPEEIPVSIATAGSLSAGAGIGSSVAISMISCNPSAIWNFLNVAVFVYLSPLQNIPAPEAFKNFTKSFGGNIFKIIPNLGLLLDVQKQQNDLEALQNYDINYSNILINSGVAFFFFCIGLLALPVFTVLYCVLYKTRLSRFFLRRIKDYRWSFFLRSFIQMYTEIMYFSLVSIKWSSFLSLDYIISVILVFLGVSFIFVSTFFTIKYRKQIEEGSLGNFESLFKEFETKRGLMVSLYYPLFLFRRLLFCLQAHFLSDYSSIQVFVNVSVSLLFIIYLIGFRPFNKKIILVLNIISEILLGAFLSLSGCFLLDLSEDSVLIVCQMCVLLVTIIPFITLAILTAKGLSMFNTGGRCIRCFKCCKKERKTRVYGVNYTENDTIVFQRNRKKII